MTAGRVRSLAVDSQDAGVRFAAESAIKSIACVEDLKAKDPATRAAAAERLGRLGWRAESGLPALVEALKDPEPSVRLAVAHALAALPQSAPTSVAPLASLLPKEPIAEVRAALIDALEILSPGTRPVLDAHLNALRDPDAQVRKRGATVQKAFEDDSVVAALGTALGDPDAAVRRAAADSLCRIMLQNPSAIPLLARAMRDESQRGAVIEALDQSFDHPPEASDSNRGRGNLAAFHATVGAAIPALREALSLKDEDVDARVIWLLGRLVSMGRQGRDPETQKAVPRRP